MAGKKVVLAVAMRKVKTSAETRKIKVDTDWARFEERRLFGATEQERAIDRHNRAVVSDMAGR
jgi:hypothetical protein